MSRASPDIPQVAKMDSDDVMQEDEDDQESRAPSPKENPKNINDKTPGKEDAIIELPPA